MSRLGGVLGCVIMLVAIGCHGSGRALPSPTSSGINPATLIDAEAESELARLGHWEDLYQVGEQIKRSRRPQVLPPKKTVLALSGGGMYGAFSAGILHGWSESGSRPNFDVITGVSTGSLIAVLVFAGPDYDPLLKRLYTQTNSDDIYRRRRVWRAIFSDALVDSTPLLHAITEVTTPEFFDRIRAEHAKGRRLYVGTTDIDGRRQVIWDMGAIASHRTPESVDLFRKVLLASTAIPGFFPPVRIQVEIDGRSYEEQHVDGSVSASLFARPPWHPEPGMQTMAQLLDGSDLYVIVAGKLFAQPEPVRPRALAIARSSVTSVIYSQSRDELFKLYTATILTGMNFRVAALRDDYEMRLSSTEFDPVEMSRLFEEGRRQILGGTAWRESPPGTEKGEAPSVRFGTKLSIAYDRQPLSLVPIIPPLREEIGNRRISDPGVVSPRAPFK